MLRKDEDEEEIEEWLKHMLKNMDKFLLDRKEKDEKDDNK